MASEINTVLVAGYGVMGRGIVTAFRRGGFQVAVLSRRPASELGLPPEVGVIARPGGAAPDLIVETIEEKTEPKLALYAQLDAAWDGAPILASNTSSLPLDDLAKGVKRPDRYVGLHYFQPADSIPLVEVVRGAKTSDATLAAARNAVIRCGQKPLVLQKAVNGFLVNRLQQALYREVYALMEQGVVTAEDVDLCAKAMLGPRMCVTGLLEQKDISGLDTHALAMRAIVPDLCHDPAPSTLVQAMYARGDIGLKTGKGFYDWRGKDPTRVRSEVARRLAEVLAALEKTGTDTPVTLR
jgi:3-hydroxybutyryl-CoA dehydrogenase